MDEILSLRTSHSKTFDAGDGQRRLEVSMCRKHYLDGSVWRDVETEWVFEDGFGNKIQKADYHARHFGNTLRFGFAPGVWADYTIPYELTFDGDTASGRIDENTEIRYTATPDGVQKRIILASKPVVEPAYQFDIKLVGCTAEVQDNSLIFYDKDGQPCGQIPSPWMMDAEGNQAFAELGFDGDTLTVVPDVGFIKSASYPVIIDPTTTFQVGTGVDNGYVSFADNTFYNTSSSFLLGDSGGNQFSSFHRFININIPQGTIITSAILQYRCNTSLSATNCITRIYASAEDNATAPTTYVGYTGKITTSVYTDWTIPALKANSWYNTPDIKSVIQEIINRSGWISGNSLLILHKNNEASFGAYRNFYSYNSAVVNGAKLIITYIGTIYGYVLLNGVANISAFGTNIIIASTNVTGFSSLFASSVNIVKTSISIAGSGVLSANGNKYTIGTTMLNGSSTLSGSGIPVRAASSSISGSSTLSATGKKIIISQSGTTGLGVLSSSSIRVCIGAPNLVGSGTLSASGASIDFGSSNLVGSGAYSASGIRVVLGNAQLSSGGSLSGTLLLIILGTAPITGVSKLSAVGWPMQPLIMPLQMILDRQDYAVVIADPSVIARITDPTVRVV